MTRKAIIALAALTGCSQNSGVPQVDRARDAMISEIGVGPELRRVGDAAEGAARRAVSAGESGNPARMAEAVGRGAAQVLCAGAGARGAASGTLARQAVRQGPRDGAVARAADAVEQAAASLPAIETPCG